MPLLFFVLAAVFAAAPVFVGVTQWQRVAEVQGGVRAVGTFHADGANCWRHRCWVELVVDGKRVEADLPALTETRENKVARDGRPIVVRYLPSDPTRAAEDGGYGYVGAITAALTLPVVILLIFALGTLVAVLRGRPPFSPWSSPAPSPS
ncbi:DUF3592 domain-containing protein [Streptomyces sp. TLI_55]|uniref:DUF3592 domain-containing protein n=1 Tax=Streptomyces sp. TLI_55 TaxID=1938861 RepID=UPI000BE234C5|nr:DUF3592 domain-containing protein [Streptomyces sp. TLI_55]